MVIAKRFLPKVIHHVLFYFAERNFVGNATQNLHFTDSTIWNRIVCVGNCLLFLNICWLWIHSHEIRVNGDTFKMNVNNMKIRFQTWFLPFVCFKLVVLNFFFFWCLCVANHFQCSELQWCGNKNKKLR